MKISTVERDGIRREVIETVSHLVARIPWPERQAMAGPKTVSHPKSLNQSSIARSASSSRMDIVTPICQGVMPC